jgi:hypothetical protein
MSRKKTNKEYEVIEIDERTTYIKGLGKVTEIGELDIEKLVKRLLQSKFITDGE